MMRLRLRLSYVGTGFCGWQIQEKADPPRTVQGELEKALAVLCRVPVRAFGSGRTDTGVHAVAQTVHCDVPDGRIIRDWRNSLNALLPKDVRVLEAAPCAPGFHARKDALCKTYAYRFWRDKRFLPPEAASFVWACGPLDENSMRKALPHLLGRHDFASLQNAGTDVESTIRTVTHCILEEMPQREFYPPHVPELRLLVTADGFLKQMVRNMAGLLAAVGRGSLSPDDIPSILEKAARQGNPAVMAPAAGLTLVSVTYP
ncbi:MAG: tRNA pseudouridine(38-40) synthase TruA [Desulfovibrio sp.]|nr:tRNA pseudouridine(38-40) synthase TruA [Desulfovibrio sp.]